MTEQVAVARQNKTRRHSRRRVLVSAREPDLPLHQEGSTQWR